MPSLISRIKDAWSVLIGKGFVSHEYNNPPVMHGRLAKTRNVRLTEDNNTIILGPGEVPLRMLRFVTPTMGVFDTSMSELADFKKTPDSLPNDRILKYRFGEYTIFGGFFEETRRLGMLPGSGVSSIEVLIEMPNYKMVKPGEE